MSRLGYVEKKNNFNKKKVNAKLGRKMFLRMCESDTPVGLPKQVICKKFT